MKLDWNLMRTILAHVEAETIKNFLRDAESLSQWKEGQLLSERQNATQPQEVRIVLFHLKLLIEGGYINGIGVKESVTGIYMLTGGANPTLTLSGFSLLESLRTDGYIDRLRAFAKEKAVPLTFETLKAIAAAYVGGSL